jgi:hypothetical protein
MQSSLVSSQPACRPAASRATCKLARLTLAVALAALWTGHARAARPPIFPLPQEIQLTGAKMPLDDTLTIAVPLQPTPLDLLLAREITADLTTRYGVAPQTRRLTSVPATGRIIVMGTFGNPLVRELCAARSLSVDAVQPGAEGYVLTVDERIALVAGSDERGAFYGMQSLRQLAVRSGLSAAFRGASVRDWPHKPFRGVKLYLPGPDNIGYFKRFVRDFMALYKYNQLILEMNANMRLDRRPELNAGSLDLARDLINTRRDRPFGPRGEFQDSVHHDNADGAILEQSEVAELVRWARQYHVDVIPEIASLSHAYYLVTRHRDIAEMRDAEWPDAYCPSNPKSYEVLFDVLEEYIQVMQPTMVHVGHDEWRIRLGACPLCRDRDTRELFAEDLAKIHGWLAKKGVATMIWGDHLIERLRGKEAYAMKTPDGFSYQRPGGLTAAMVQERIPKDILVANWFWQEPLTGQGEVNDLDLAEWGFRQVYGNLEPHIRNWERRSSHPSVIGGAPSSWAATTEFNFGKDQMFDFLACANLLWSKHWPSLAELTPSIQAMMPELRERLSGQSAFSTSGDPQAPVSLGAGAGTPVRVRVGAVRFDVGPAPPITVRSGETGPAVSIGQDVSSLVFLHAIEKRAGNTMAYRIIHNFEDTADLLGHYEVLYEDGLVVTVPIRYGVNVMERTWTPATRARSYCYLADPVDLGPDQTFFSYEWRNPRLGKAIRSVSLRASSGYINARGVKLEDNAVLLRAITMVQPRPIGRGQRVTTEDLNADPE